MTGLTFDRKAEPIQWQDVWRVLRPRQWIKNGFILAGIIFADELRNPLAWVSVGLTFVAFCMLASCAYVLNDWVDAPRDRLHPLKRLRPIAAGRLHRGQIFVLLAGTLGGGLVTLALVNRHVLVVGALYLVLNLLYSWFLKNVFLLDAMSIAAGFLLRALAGTMAIRVPASPWLFILVVLLTLFLALGKRRSEIRLLTTAGASHRKVLETYSIALIDQYLTVLMAAVIITYAIYAYLAPHGSHWLIVSLLFVIYGLFRYMWLLQHVNAESPDEVITRDIPTLINLSLWVLTVMIIILYAP